MAQALHTRFDVDVHGVLSYWPAGHGALHVVHVSAFVVVEYVPAAHCAHCRFTDGLHGVVS